MKHKMLKKINEIGRVITYAPTQIGGNLQNRLVPELSNDRTNLNNEDTLKILLDLAIGDDKSISFVNKYDDKIPSLGVNPTVQYDTPHGIYSYPFNKQTLINMIYTGSPTEARFATDYDFIHVFKTDNIAKVKISDDFSTNVYDNYNNKAQYQIDLKQIIKTSIIFAIDFYNEAIRYRFSDLLFTKVLEGVDLGSTKEEKIYSLEKLLNIMIENIRSLSASSDTNLFRNRYSNLLAVVANLMQAETTDIDEDDVLIKKETGLINFYTEKLLPIIDSLATKTLSTYRGSNEKVKSRGGLFYKIYYICFITSKTLCDLTVASRENESGSFFTLLLDLIGIKSVDDNEGSATIHPNEPTQSFAAGYGPQAQYELLGTFNNIFKLRMLKDIFDNLLNDEKISNEYAEFSSSIVTIEKISKIKNIEKLKIIISKFKKNINRISDFFYQFFLYNKNESFILNDLYDYIMNDLKMPKVLFSINAFQIIRKDAIKINTLFNLLIRYKSELDVYNYFNLLTTVVNLNFDFSMLNNIKLINNLNIQNQRKLLNELIFFIKTKNSYSDLAFDYYKKFMICCDLSKDEIFDSVEELENYFKTNPSGNQTQQNMIKLNHYEKLKFEILLNSSKIEITDSLYNLIIEYLTEEMTYEQLYKLIFLTKPPAGKALTDVIRYYENPSFIKRIFNDDNFKQYIDINNISIYIDVIKDIPYYDDIINNYLITIKDNIKISDLDKVILLLDSNNIKALNIIKDILHGEILVGDKDIYSNTRYFTKLIRNVINNVKNKSISISILSLMLNCESDDFNLYTQLNLYTILNFSTVDHQIIDFYRSFELKTKDPLKKKFLNTLVVSCIANEQLNGPI